MLEPLHANFIEHPILPVFKTIWQKKNPHYRDDNAGQAKDVI